MKKSVTFKSSPDISYYERSTPDEAEEEPDHNDVSKDLTSAEVDLDDEARALYHKVLSSKCELCEVCGVSVRCVR